MKCISKCESATARGTRRMNLRNIDIDKADIIFYVGLLMLGGGLGLKALWLGLSVVGGILVLVSIMGAIRK